MFSFYNSLRCRLTRHICCSIASANTHFRAPLRLPLPAAPHGFNTPGFCCPQAARLLAEALRKQQDEEAAAAYAAARAQKIEDLKALCKQQIAAKQYLQAVETAATGEQVSDLPCNIRREGE